MRVVVLYQTLEQLRSASPLNGQPMHVNVAVPGCSGQGCAPEALAVRLTRDYSCRLRRVLLNRK